MADSDYREHQRRLLVASVPMGAAAIAAMVLFYQASSLVMNDRRTVPYISLYVAELMIPFAGFVLVRGPLSRRPLPAALFTDLAFTLAIVGQLLLPLEPLARIALVLSLKIVATAWLFSWSGGVQCVSAIASALIYWALLLASQRPVSEIGLLHEVIGPLGAVALSVAGSASAERARRALFQRDKQIAATEQELRSLLAQAREGEDRLRQANAVKSDFVATVSHEFRTPLNIILGYIDLLRDGEFGPVTGHQKETLNRVRFSSHELLELINGVLNLNRLESTEVPLDLQTVDLTELIREIDEEVGNLPRNPDVRWLWTIDEILNPLHTDPFKLKLVLKNLVSNALKFTEQGTVELRANNHGDGIECTVKDTGIGIAPEHHQLIFESFSQVSSNRRPKHGFGLGLYIVSRLVDALGGTVGVESTLGEGATFRVLVPSLRAKHPASDGH